MLRKNKQYLLNTDVLVSFYQTGPREDLFKFMEVVPVEDTFISVFSLIGIDAAIKKATLKHDGSMREAWRGRIISIDPDIADYIKKIDSESFNIQVITATAMMHDLIITTKETALFEPYQVKVMNPFDLK